MLSVITGHSGYGPGLPPSLRELPCPHWHHLQLPAFILFISALYQAEIKPRLVRAAEAAGAGLSCRKAGEEGSRCGSPAGAQERGAPAATGWQQNPRSRERAGAARTAAAAWDRGRGWALGFLFASRTVWTSDKALVSPAHLEIVWAMGPQYKRTHRTP